MTTQRPSTSPPAERGGGHRLATTVPGPKWARGLSIFAGLIMMVSAVLNEITASVALFMNQIFARAPQYSYAFDIKTWGWIHLIGGLLIGVAGWGVLSGQLWARVLGIIVAGSNLVSNFMFIPYHPIWSVLLAALNFFVIWALCVCRVDYRRL